jgi:hypothetical protein
MVHFPKGNCANRLSVIVQNFLMLQGDTAIKTSSLCFLENGPSLFGAYAVSLFCHGCFKWKDGSSAAGGRPHLFS